MPKLCERGQVRFKGVPPGKLPAAGGGAVARSLGIGLGGLEISRPGARLLLVRIPGRLLGLDHTNRLCSLRLRLHSI